MDRREVLLDQLEATLTPVVGPGGQFLPSDPKRWSGKGRYDIGKDELTIAADANHGGDSSQANGPRSLADRRLRAGGLKTRGAAWVEANLAGDLAESLPRRRARPSREWPVD